MALSVDDLKDTLDVLEDNFDAAYANAPDDDARAQLRHTLTAARDAFWKACRDGLEDETPFVTQLAADLKEQNRKLQAAAGNLADFATFLGVATDAVKLAAAIATLAVA
jgi:hypothetical protein